MLRSTISLVFDFPRYGIVVQNKECYNKYAMGQHPNKITANCTATSHADARKIFSKTAYAAAAPIYEIHEATGFCLERLTNAASLCNKLFLDQKEQRANLVQLTRQIDAEIDELTIENGQLEERLKRLLNN